jgi:hypothetical protein
MKIWLKKVNLSVYDADMNMRINLLKAFRRSGHVPNVEAIVFGESKKKVRK